MKKTRGIKSCDTVSVNSHLNSLSFASALMHCGEHSEANQCAETVLMNDPSNVRVSIHIYSSQWQDGTN